MQLVTRRKSACSYRTSRAACSAAATMPPPPACGDLNSHPKLSAWRSLRMLVMRVIILDPYNKFEVRKPSRSEDMADFRSRR